MDDLKLVAENHEELKELLKLVKQFSDDINMEFGLNKCAKATFIKVKLQRSQNFKIDINAAIRLLDQPDVNKYLKMGENETRKHEIMTH